MPGKELSEFVVTLKKAMAQKGLNASAVCKLTKYKVTPPVLSKILNGILPDRIDVVYPLAMALDIDLNLLKVAFAREKISEMLDKYNIKESEMWKYIKKVDSQPMSVIPSDSITNYLDDNGFLLKRSSITINSPSNEFGTDCYAILVKDNVLLRDILIPGDIVVIAVGASLRPPPDYGIIRYGKNIKLAKIRLDVNHYVVETFIPYHSEYIHKKNVFYVHPIRCILRTGIPI